MSIWSFWTIAFAMLWHSSPFEFLSSDNFVQPNLDCAFEDGMCAWQDSSASSILKWRVYRGRSSLTNLTGPKGDHTTQYGNYLVMRTEEAYEAGSTILDSPLIVTHQETCLSFWYFMHGYQMGSLNVYKTGQEDNMKTDLFSMSGPQGTRWYKADIKTGTGTFMLEIEATFKWRDAYADIAIDDITFTYKPCKEDESGIMKDKPDFDCDFEDDLCSWYSMGHRQLQWRQFKVPYDTIHRDALPPQSNGTSYAVLLRSRSGYSERLDLSSPAISVDMNEACMTCWFKMEGKMASRFLVKVEYRKDMQVRTRTVFSTVEKTQGWVQAFITFPELKQFVVHLRGESEKWSYGKIAVDDIRLTRGGPCPKVKQEHLINCDFEKDFCRWYMVSKTVDGDWLRTKDPTPTNGTGPLHGHGGDGYYIFLDAVDVEVARLHSPLFNVGDGGACLSFWYYMFGEDVYRLELVYKSYGTNAKVIWSLEGSQEERWMQQNVSLPTNNDVHLLFTAMRGYFPRSDIALDDINISFGSLCNEGVPTTTTSPSSVIPEETSLPTTKHTTSPLTEPPPIVAPQLIAEGNINPVYKDSRVVLVCQQPYPSLMTKWFKQNPFLLSGFEELIDHNGERNLVFDEIQMSDSGTFRCTVSRNFQDIISESDMSNPLDINVVQDPRAKPLLYVEGDNAEIDGRIVDLEMNAIVKLTCGRPSENGQYHWRTTSSAFTDSTLPNDRILVLNGTKTEHNGVYSCRISKDGLLTAKSNELYFIVKKGKRCTFSSDCLGVAYSNYCSPADNRCRCQKNAVLDGRACKMRPATPKIVTSPPFQEFGIGESFYLICKPEAPVFHNLTYAFKHDRWPAAESFRVLKIANATETDSGRYECAVTYDNVTSYDSQAIHVQIRDFVNLSCDFTNDFCAWSQGHDISTTEFVAASTNDGDESTQERNGPFIQLDASKTTVPNRAVLVSPTIERMTLDSCLSFSYRMRGSDVHSLSVWKFSLERFSSFEVNYVGTEIWTVVGEKGNDWVRGNATVEKGSNFYITFEAIGQAAIDDVIFTYRGGC